MTVYGLKQMCIRDRTYSENVENAFQDCDINNLIPDTAEYTTRSDWSKGWKEVESITPIEEMMKGLTNSTYELTENSDEEVVWGADNGLSTVDFLQFNEDGTFAGALPLSCLLYTSRRCEYRMV